MSTRHVLVADWHPADFEIERAPLESRGITWSMPGWKPPPPPREEQIRQLLERIQQAERIDGVLFALAPLPKEVIHALPATCKHLQRVGIGLDLVDLDAVQARGMTIDNTPDYATEEVAVQALGMLLSLHRQLGATQSVLLAGQWKVQPPEPIERLSTLTLGLVGLGRIGRKFGELMRPLVKRILFSDPAVSTPPAGMESMPLETVLRDADLISLHCPLLPQTRGLINARTLQLVKPTAILINVSRGALIEADAVAQAVRERRLAGLGVDVYEPEVLPKDSPLRTLGDRAILTSHTAWYSKHSVIDCRTQAIQKLIARLEQTP